MIELGPKPTEFDEPESMGESKAGSDLTELGNSIADAGKSPENFGSETFTPKFGVFVETRFDDSLRLGGNFSSLLEGKFGLKVDGEFVSGGNVLGSELTRPELPLGGVSSGAGSNGGFDEAGKADVGDVAAVLLCPNGLAFPGDEKPFGGVLLNMSNAFVGLPGLFETIGPGTDTSGKVWSRSAKSNSGLRGVLVPFMAM